MSGGANPVLRLLAFPGNMHVPRLTGRRSDGGNVRIAAGDDAFEDAEAGNRVDADREELRGLALRRFFAGHVRRGALDMRPADEQESQFDPPGPSPWYLGEKGSLPAEGYEWSEAGDGDDLPGLSALRGPSGDMLLILGSGCYVRPLTDLRLLLWYAWYEGRGSTDPRVCFEIVDLANVDPIDDPYAAAPAIYREEKRSHYRGASVCEFVFRTCVRPGVHELGRVPPDLVAIGEVLVLAEHGRKITDVFGLGRPHMAIFAFQFTQSRVEVIPQDWFNNGDYDFGAQWITRVARKPQSNRIFGEGIRLGFFRLSKSGRNVEEWLTADPFHGRRG